MNENTVPSNASLADLYKARRQQRMATQSKSQQSGKGMADDEKRGTTGKELSNKASLANMYKARKKQHGSMATRHHDLKADPGSKADEKQQSKAAPRSSRIPGATSASSVAVADEKRGVMSRRTRVSQRWQPLASSIASTNPSRRGASSADPEERAITPKRMTVARNSRSSRSPTTLKSDARRRVSAKTRKQREPATSSSASSSVQPQHNSRRPSRKAARSLHVLFFQDTAECYTVFCDYADLGNLSCANRAFRSLLARDRLWRSACVSVASAFHLYLPQGYALGWRRLFFEQLWPAHRKWATVDRYGVQRQLPGQKTVQSPAKDGESFTIRVAVRFRPGREPLSDTQATIASSSTRGPLALKKGFVLPLHQRVQLVRRGLLDPARLFEHGEDSQSDEQLIQSLAASGALPPDVLEALMEAEYLDEVGKNAAAETEHKTPLKWKGLERTPGSRPRDDDAEDAAVGSSAAFPDVQLPLTGDGGDVCTDVAAPGGTGGDPDSSPSSTGGNTTMTGTTVDDVTTPSSSGGADAEDARRKQHARLVAIQESNVAMLIPGQGVKSFPFAHVLSDDASQYQVYERAARDSVIGFLNGFNACLLCYGQTGSGKTHTIFGPRGIFGTNISDDLRSNSRVSSSGVVLRTCAEVLTAIQSAATRPLAPEAEAAASIGVDPEPIVGLDDEDAEYMEGWADAIEKPSSVSDGKLFPSEDEQKTRANGTERWRRGISSVLSVRYCQLYQGRFMDLLSGERVQLVDGGTRQGNEQFQLLGAREVVIHSLNDVIRVLHQGEKWKRYASTAMNTHSSRAHTVFILSLLQENEVTGTAVRSHLHLVDLAGSEQVKQSQVTGQRLQEAIQINSSLLTLGKVITSLVQGLSHIPYHESPLTMLLKSALGGNSRTTAMVTCSSDPEHGDQTLQSLRFGQRCALIENVTVSNTSSVEEAIASIQGALARCQQHIEAMEASGNAHLPAYARLKSKWIMLDQKRQALQRKIEG